MKKMKQTTVKILRKGKNTLGSVAAVSAIVNAPMIKFLVVALLLSFIPSIAGAQKISKKAAEQIEALINEKMQRTPAQRKINSRLLFGIKRDRGDAIFNAVPRLRTRVKVVRNQKTLVDINAKVTQAVLDQIQTGGGSVISSFSRFDAIRALVPLNRLEALAALPAVKSIRPADKAIHNKTNISEGDVAHRAAQVRSLLGFDGTGVKIGVISDGVDTLAARQATGDLPLDVTVLPGQAGSGDEGTAMLEIVFDLAPGAELFFATSGASQAAFAQNILDLNAAGCQIIVDDVFFFAESVFQDGIIAQAYNTVAASDPSVGGAVGFSAGGNSGNLNDGTSGVWEGDYVATTLPASILTGLDANDFGGGNPFNTMTKDPPFAITLHWSDSIGGSANDYDLFLLNAAGDQVFASSTNFQSGSQDPFEIIDSEAFEDTGNLLVIVRFAGNPRFMHLNTIRGELSVATDGQMSGHSAAASVFSVAAVSASGTNVPFNGSESVETFSSDGPRRIFYLPDGTAITPGNFLATGGLLLEKPDIAAADGVLTDTPGFGTFFGTSAAAPHAAAMAALLLGANPRLTQAEIYAAFTSTALDIEAAGVDRDSGAGIIDAFAAANAIPAISVTPTSGLITTEAGGQATFSVVLTTVSADNVTIGLSSNNTAEGTVAPPSLTFTPGNALTPQVVTITGVDDAIDDGDVNYTILTAAAVSPDTDYNGLDPRDVSVTNEDDDAVGISVVPTSGLVTTEAGGEDTFTVVLTSEPTGNVTIDLSSDNTAEGTVAPPSLTFTPGNALTPQVVTITGVDDFIVDGDVAYTISTAAAVSSDTDYNGLDPSDISGINQDDDAPMVLDVRVSESSDDAEERQNSTLRMFTASNDIELVQDRTNNQKAGLRFNGLGIPKGAIITNAYVQFQVDEVNTETTSLIIQGEASDNATTFTTTGGDISSRPLTAAAVSWSPPNWTTVGAAGPNQRTIDIAPVIQEIIGRAGWVSGNSLAIIISGTGERTAESFDGNAQAAPLLHVEYATAAGGNQPPAVTITAPATPPTITAGDSVDFTGTAIDAEDGDISGTLDWISDLDGPLATNDNSFSTTDLVTVGTHTIIASTTDSGGLPGSDTITVTVNPVGNTAPAVTITAPATPPTITAGDSVDFTGTAIDAEDGNISGTLDWSSDLDGSLATNDNSFSTTNLVTVGTHTIIASTTDSGGLPGSDTITVTVTSGGGGPGVVDKRVAPDSSDDAEEQKGERMLTGSADLELGYDKQRKQKVGLLFNNIMIPPGATINNAHIQFQADETGSEPVELTINGQLSLNPVTFTTTDSEISNRIPFLTNASVTWSPAAWTTVGEAGVAQQTPDIAPVIQEIVGQQGWSSGNPLAIIICTTSTNTLGKRTAESSDGVAQAAPLLHVEFTTP